MFKNRLIIGGPFLWFVLWLPIFAISQKTSDVASWFIHDDPSCMKQDATLQGSQEGRASSAATSCIKQDATYNVPWSVLNEGGKTEEVTSASYKLKDAIGQPVIGTCESASYKAYIGFWTPRPLGIVGVEEKFVESGTLPLVYSLSQNYPNPFNSLTAISYSIAKSAVGGRSSAVSLRIYDLTGRLVRTLVDEPQEPGYYKVNWDGKDNSGERVAPGVYFYKLITGEYRSVKKMVILR